MAQLAAPSPVGTIGTQAPAPVRKDRSCSRAVMAARLPIPKQLELQQPGKTRRREAIQRPWVLDYLSLPLSLSPFGRASKQNPLQEEEEELLC